MSQQVALTHTISPRQDVEERHVTEMNACFVKFGQYTMATWTIWTAFSQGYSSQGCGTRREEAKSVVDNAHTPIRLQPRTALLRMYFFTLTLRPAAKSENVAAVVTHGCMHARCARTMPFMAAAYRFHWTHCQCLSGQQQIICYLQHTATANSPLVFARGHHVHAS